MKLSAQSRRFAMVWQADSPSEAAWVPKLRAANTVLSLTVDHQRLADLHPTEARLACLSPADTLAIHSALPTTLTVSHRQQLWDTYH